MPASCVIFFSLTFYLREQLAEFQLEVWEIALEILPFVCNFCYYGGAYYLWHIFLIYPIRSSCIWQYFWIDPLCKDLFKRELLILFCLTVWSRISSLVRSHQYEKPNLLGPKDKTIYLYIMKSTCVFLFSTIEK